MMDVVALTEQFLGHIFSGDMDNALTMVAPRARFIGTRPEPSDENPMFGTFIGPEGAQALFAAFGSVIEPGEFSVTGKFGAGDHACLYGQLRHQVRSTGRPFPSDWALITQFADGKLTSYHFYEDTAALAEAMLPA